MVNNSINIEDLYPHLVNAVRSYVSDNSYEGFNNAWELEGFESVKGDAQCLSITLKGLEEKSIKKRDYGYEIGLRDLGWSGSFGYAGGIVIHPKFYDNNGSR